MLLAGAGHPALGAQPAEDEPENTICRVVQVDMTPTDGLQIVVWIEDGAGNYVDTAFITQLTGTYGLGNRPGIMDFNSGWRWPYGRRTSTFPVWAHRHGMTWPLVIFQDELDRNLSHRMDQSSVEGFYCRPLREDEPAWDTMTCASKSYTDKGMLSDTETSVYPPRSDVVFTPDIDHDSVRTFARMNPFDAVSRPTPLGGEPFQVSWKIPDGLPAGDYVAWVEVSKEFDQNMHFDFPEPDGISYAQYGEPYRGQPSVVYRVPFAIMPDMEVVASVGEYAGYGDPGGLDGTLNPPDDLITTGVPGTGASRLLLTVDGDEMFRVRVRAQPGTPDVEMPGVPEDMEVMDTAPDAVTISFVAPGDDDDIGRVTGYDVRYLAGEPMTVESFSRGLPITVPLVPVDPDAVQTLTVTDLLPRLDYSIGVRAYDECGNYGGLAVIQVSTPERTGGTVDACFVATAAHGSVMAGDVAMLRRFRDRFLRTHVTGELLVQGYYTFGPALARLIAPSDTLRRAARAGLAPLVEAAGGLLPAE